MGSLLLQGSIEEEVDTSVVGCDVRHLVYRKDLQDFFEWKRYSKRRVRLYLARGVFLASRSSLCAPGCSSLIN